MVNIGFFKNRDVLCAVLETLEFLGKNDMDPYKDPNKNPNKYHYESSDDDEFKGIDNSNLQSILNLRMITGDARLTQQFGGLPETQKFIPRQIQNDLLKLLGQSVMEGVAKEARKSEYYSIIASDTKGISNIEDSFPISVRYVDDSRNIVELPLAYVHGELSCSVEVALNVCHTIKKANLDLRKCRALCLDASRYTNTLKAARVIAHQHPLALQFHNHATLLNEILPGLLHCAFYQTYLIRKMSDFFNSNDRFHKVLNKQLQETASKHVLQELSEKRPWLSRHNYFHYFLESFEAIVYALEFIEHDPSFPYGCWGPSNESPGNLLLYSDSLEFVFNSVIARHVFTPLVQLSTKLQGDEVDVIEAYEDASSSIKNLVSFKDNVDAFHGKLFFEAKELAAKLQIPDKRPPGKETSEIRYKEKITIPMLDSLIEELKERFSHKKCIAVKGQVIVPAIMQKWESSGRTNSKELFMEFALQYKEDMACFDDISLEFDSWKRKYSKRGAKSIIPKDIKTTLRKADPREFPNIASALRILAVLPVADFQDEASAAALRRMRSFLKHREENWWKPEPLALLHTHRNICNNLAVIMDQYEAMVNELAASSKKLITDD